MMASNVPFHKTRRLITVGCCIAVLPIAWQMIVMEQIKKTTSERTFPMNLKGREKALPILSANPCNYTYFPEHLIQKEDMQSVASVNWTFIYSAFHDVERPNVVKIVGICQLVDVTYFCQVWFKENNGTTMTMRTSNATVELCNGIRKGFNEISLSCYILCPVDENISPFAISIVSDLACAQANNMIQIQTIKKRHYTRNFTMCLSPFHSNMSNAEGLVEWIEFNRILGAEKFFLYNFFSALNIKAIIRYYVDIGVVDFLQWPLHKVTKRFLDPFSDIDDYAQISAYNDCGLRNREQSKYVVITDLDEFIVPRGKDAKTWNDMLESLPPKDAFTFRNSFFPIKNIRESNRYPEKEIAQKYRLMTLLAAKRHIEIFPCGPRSKYLTKTNSSYNLLTHVQYGARAHCVDPLTAVLHHYRKGFDANDYKIPMVTDKTVLNKYGNELTSRIANVWSKIKSL